MRMLLTLAVGALLSWQAQAAEKQPNILLIVADDLGYSDIQPFGGEVHTPSLQDLANQGARLTNFYAGPTCSVTRSMLLSGVDSHQAGLGTMAEGMQPEQKGKPGYEGYLNFSVATIAELLGAAGYDTYMTGKWHLGGAPGQTPAARGFQQSYILVQGGASHVDLSEMFPGYAARYLDNDKPAQLPAQFYSSDLYTEQMLDYLKRGQRDGKPFFAYLAYTAPHWPLQAPEQYIDKYRGQYDKGYEAIRQARLARMQAQGLLPAGTSANVPMRSALPSWDELTPAQRQEQARTMEIYAAMIDNLDHNIGRVLDYLKQTGELDNTFILFMSDNGAEGTTAAGLEIADWVRATFDNGPANMGRKGSYLTLGPQWGQVSATPFPYFKGFTSRGGINVPAIVRYPKMVKAGQVNSQLFHAMDLMPSVLELAGVHYPERFANRALLPLQGRSMLAGLANAGAQPQRELGWELYGRRSLRKGDWSVQMQAPPYGSGHWELYDLANDPSTQHDLSARYPEKTAELAADWGRYAQHNGVVDAPVRYKYTYENCLYERCVK
ncbi:arylsulfatase [Pseudomonas sp. S37]|uniref:arylsulfatase n=1 Tax=Pseudomonas sp. S37 TaxID=2767449 RepID=UPI001912088F|nr:arylsulfatase [Pseudomonas sp. S37]MBK4995978.1 arylsulfatase [Pseudomonas sp. S37]